MAPDEPVKLELVNLTQHEVVVCPGGDNRVVLPRSGGFARLQERRQVGQPVLVEGSAVPVTNVHYDDAVIDLPRPRAGVGYVVSRITAAARPRPDVYFPFDEIRDETGRIVGCRGLGQFADAAGRFERG